MDDQLPTPNQAPEPETEQPAKPKQRRPSGRFAVYDNELRRFVGGVHDTKPSAKDAKVMADGHDYDIREL